MKVAKAVLLAHVGKPPAGRSHVCHRNDIATDNRLVNLYWGNNDSNVEDRKRRGGFPCGENSPRAILTKTQVTEMVKLRAVGKTRVQIAKEIGVAYHCVVDVLKGKAWGSFTGIRYSPKKRTNL